MSGPAVKSLTYRNFGVLARRRWFEREGKILDVPDATEIVLLGEAMDAIEESSAAERALLQEKVEEMLSATPEPDKTAMHDWEIDDYIIAARAAALREVLALLKPGEEPA